MTYSLIRLLRPLKMSSFRQPMLLLDKSLKDAQEITFLGYFFHNFEIT